MRNFALRKYETPTGTSSDAGYFLSARIGASPNVALEKYETPTGTSSDAGYFLSARIGASPNVASQLNINSG